MSGKIMVDNTDITGKRVICFVVENCHFIFMLLVEGNMVSAVEYVSRM